MKTEREKENKKEKKIDLSLYLVTDRRLLQGLSLTDLVRKAVYGGVTVVQLREKECSSREFYELALELKKIMPTEIPLIINDRVDIALAVRADGVHLGQSDLPVKTARELLGQEAIIGLSVENLKQLEEALHLPVDYLAISPVFPTPTKTDFSSPAAWGLDGLRQARNLTELPLVAIGGINEENAEKVISAGADGLAVVSAICASSDPEQAARALKEKIEQARKKKN
ncbi:MAG: thiamine phosphate synthase [Candidatus Aminicenantes bacterium]|nr:thiamine phosphate synthase [Candidatus Aminicenantes bacterium]